VPPSDRYPISCDLLLAFVCSFAGKVRADTVRNHLSALSTWHAVWGLPWTKTTRESGLLKSVAAVGGELDPDGSALVPLDKETMIATFNAALLKAGRSAFTGHSFRIGGATAHWHAGASLSDIKLIGGWKSNVVVKYLRDYAAGLLPAHRRTAAAIAEVAARSAAPPATEA
ncbi:hypothetical protein OC834_006863, partial [Tilletia horrida]